MIHPNEFLPLIGESDRSNYILIELIQKDAYNEAIYNAAEFAKLKHIYEYSGNCGEYDESYDIVDKDSILKLLKK